MILDCIVVGLTDTSLAEKLPLDPELTYSRESNRKGMTIRNSQQAKSSSKGRYSWYPMRKPSKDKRLTESKQEHCTYQVWKPHYHAKQNCPAKDSVFHRLCKKKGHYQSQCKSKKAINSIMRDILEELENAFLGTIHLTNSHTTEWLIELYLNEVPITFRINTSAEVTSNPEAIATSFKVIMRVPIKTLLRPGMNSLNACEQFTCTLKQNIRNLCCERSSHTISGLHSF